MSNDRWMGALLDEGVDLGRLSLRDAAWPGTHDSVTFGIDVPGVRAVTRCQGHPIAGQLRAGARFLDIRLAYRDGDYYGHHNIVHTPTKLEEILGDIAAFFRDPAHEHELLILRVSHLSGVGDEARELDLLRRLVAAVGEWCAPRPAPRTVQSATSTTIGDLLGGKHQIVLVFQNEHLPDEDIESGYPVWCNDEGSDDKRLLTMDTVWGNTDEVGRLLKKLPKFQEEQADAPSLFVLQTVLTPQIPLELHGALQKIEHLITSGPSHWSVEALSRDYNAKMLAWLANPGSRGRVNIVFMNFLGEPFTRLKDQNLIDLVAGMNRARAHA